MDNKTKLFLSLFSLAFLKYLALPNGYVDLIAMAICGGFAALIEVEVFYKEKRALSAALVEIHEELASLKFSVHEYHEEVQKDVKGYREESSKHVAEMKSAIGIQKLSGRPGQG